MENNFLEVYYSHVIYLLYKRHNNKDGFYYKG